MLAIFQKCNQQLHFIKLYKLLSIIIINIDNFNLTLNVLRQTKAFRTNVLYSSLALFTATKKSSIPAPVIADVPTV